VEKTIQTAQGNIRRLDTGKDLSEAADLIQMCFQPYLDEDGYMYLDQIRRAARNPWLVRWTRVAGEMVSYPLNGYIWEEDGKIVGNLSLIPFIWQQKWIYLIANVAVHPDYRQRGIASKLTERALLHLRSHSIDTVWLHVRQDNQIARHLYERLDFKAQCTRDTWLNKTDPSDLPIQPDVVVTRRLKKDWDRQLIWLNETYPPEVAWNLGFDQKRFAPGWFASLNLLFKGQRMAHWSASLNHHLLGVASWEPSFQIADTLWLALEPGSEVESIPALLRQVRSKIPRKRPLVVNFPAERARDAFRSAGFELLNTLVWMQIHLDISKNAGHLTL
jgi:ribosomal protein S18 acetylase RimI-like enzyme